MKKYLILLGIIVALSLTAVVCAVVGSDASGHNGSAAVTQYKVVYVKDGQAFLTELVEKDGTATPPDEEDIPNGKFISWCLNGREYDFATPVKSETVLTAVYNRRYNVTFCADGETVKSAEYTYFSRNSLEAPDVPAKLGYACGWEEFTLDGGDKTVNATYSPITYDITFMLGGTNVQEVTCTIEDYVDKIPAAPQKQGFDCAWAYERQNGNEITATLKYTPIKYEINFVADGELIKTEYLTADEYDLYAPEAPQKEHYVAEWEQADFSERVITVNAVYTPVVYTASFCGYGGQTLEVKYTILDEFLQDPEIPQKEFYDGKWESYTLPYKDFCVNAEYTAKEYLITFFADGAEAGKAIYTVETDVNSLTVPEVPLKAGYVGEWAPFELSGGDLEVSAVYTPVVGTDGLTYKKSGNGYVVTGYNGSANEVVVPSFHKNLPVTEVAEYAFKDCTFEKITICENITALRESAFLRCKALKQAELPQSLETIGDSAFYLCSDLVEISIPSGVKQIGAMAFCGCTSLESVSIGAGVERISEGAFLMCENLQTAYFAVADGWTNGNNPSVGEMIAQSPQSAARALTEFCDYDIINLNKENL